MGPTGAAWAAGEHRWVAVQRFVDGLVERFQQIHGERLMPVDGKHAAHEKARSAHRWVVVEDSGYHRGGYSVPSHLFEGAEEVGHGAQAVPVQFEADSCHGPFMP